MIFKKKHCFTESWTFVHLHSPLFKCLGRTHSIWVYWVSQWLAQFQTSFQGVNPCGVVSLFWYPKSWPFCWILGTVWGDLFKAVNSANKRPIHVRCPVMMSKWATNSGCWALASYKSSPQLRACGYSYSKLWHQNSFQPFFQAATTVITTTPFLQLGPY